MSSGQRAEHLNRRRYHSGSRLATARLSHRSVSSHRVEIAKRFGSELRSSIPEFRIQKDRNSEISQSGSETTALFQASDFAIRINWLATLADFTNPSP
jgi:hypothetical protein